MHIRSLVTVVSVCANVVAAVVILESRSHSPRYRAGIALVPLKLNDVAGCYSEMRADGVPLSIQRGVLKAIVAYNEHPDLTFPIGNVNAEYWHSNFDSILENAFSKLQENDRRQDEEVEQIMGAAVATDPAQSWVLKERFGDIPIQKALLVRSILVDSTEATRRVTSAARGVMLPIDRKSLQEIRAKRETMLSNSLTPAEREGFELRSSSIAVMLRAQLEPFNPSETEFKALFNLQRDFDARYSGPVGRSSAAAGRSQNERSDAEEKLKAAIANALGPTRYQYYLRVTNPKYLQIHRLCIRLNLPTPETEERMLALQTETNAAIDSIAQDKSRTVTERQAAITDIRHKGRASAIALLTNDGLHIYLHDGGEWLDDSGTPSQTMGWRPR